MFKIDWDKSACQEQWNLSAIENPYLVPGTEGI
jgi:hypothetical protein